MPWPYMHHKIGRDGQREATNSAPTYVAHPSSVPHNLRTSSLVQTATRETISWVMSSPSRTAPCDSPGHPGYASRVVQDWNYNSISCRLLGRQSSTTWKSWRGKKYIFLGQKVYIPLGSFSQELRSDKIPLAIKLKFICCKQKLKFIYCKQRAHITSSCVPSYFPLMIRSFKCVERHPITNSSALTIKLLE